MEAGSVEQCEVEESVCTWIERAIERSSTDVYIQRMTYEFDVNLRQPKWLFLIWMDDKKSHLTS